MTYGLEYDNRVADACGAVGIHHCGSVNEVLDGYAKVRHLQFVEIGFGSDVHHSREVFGPDVAINARINPVLMKNGTIEEVTAEVRRLIDDGAPLENFSIDTVGLTHGTPDENVKTALATAAEYGRIGKEAPGRPHGVRAGKERRKSSETVIGSATQTVTVGPDRPLVIIGERINPTGRKDLAEALEQGNLEQIQAEARIQVEAGAHILDVNVGVSGIDEPRLLKEAIQAIREVTDVPLCIDSALPKALEAGLEACEGKALVNSVNGEAKKMAEVFPLVKSFGAAVIGLTMDDRGIPTDPERRLEIARQIVERAEREGIPPEDVIIDPLAMAVSADYRAGLQTLKTLQLIRDELGVNQTLGLSNISFGLPERWAVNSVFLAMAVVTGLTCAIADPTVEDLQRAVLIADMLQGRDEFCMTYLNTTARWTGTQQPRPAASKEETSGDDLEALKEAVIHGRRKEAAERTQDALDQGINPQEIINSYLIPALNVVGERFEQKKIFIPEMMMAAKSMQACVDLIKPLMKAEGNQALGTVVLGTVFGDLHDIGKNLVRLLLETSGFRVIDLGENVPAEQFLEAAKKNNAHIVGISSLLTTGDPHVKETIRVIRESELGDRVKIICGGAALTLKFVESSGADAYAKDAADGVKKSKALVGAAQSSAG
jgi:5-methyltetrahydrofolate--homocysteine methyltransferase